MLKAGPIAALFIFGADAVSFIACAVAYQKDEMASGGLWFVL